ncbi:hypothetical protein Tco_1093969 [Tanacetum coccineum]|uniref:Uncharacterized protein n=1 Tax=Tanacetum coccineum TaxID=301880 RepID=A0ABQ5IE83_9ASTR
MTTLVIDLTMSQHVCKTVQAPLPTSTATVTTITTTTSLPLPPPQPQQSTTDPILVRRIGKLEQHMANLLQDNLALGERLDKHGTRLYNLEKLDIPYKVSQAVDEIVTDAVGWAMQAPLRARFRDLPIVDMKEILQQQILAEQEEARKKRRKRRDAPRSPPGSPPSQPPPPPPPAGASGAPGTSGASGSSQLLPPPPPPSTDESIGIAGAQELSPSDDMMHDDSAPDEQWKTLPEEERLATPEPTWTILPSNVSDVENNWASALASSYESPAENSLLAKTGDMTTFLNWYCHQINKSKLTRADLEGQAYEVVKVFYPDTIHLQFQMEECHKMLIDQVDWQIRKEIKSESILGNKVSMPVISISKMKAARYPDFSLELLVPEQMWIKDVCTYDISANEIVLSKSRLPRTTIAEKDFKNLYPSDFEDLNLLLLQNHLDHLFGLDKWMLLTAVKLWTRNLVIRQRVEDFQLGIESYQTQLNLTKPGWDTTGYEFKHDYTIIESPRAFSDGTLTRILETLDYKVKEFKIKRLNPGMNMRFWTEKDVPRSNEFITAIERRLKTRRIYQNLECFVGRRARDIDYRLL